MIFRGRADRLQLSSDDNGWNLFCETDEGDTIVLNIHDVAYQFASSKEMVQLLDWTATANESRSQGICDGRASMPERRCVLPYGHAGEHRWRRGL